MPVFGTDRMEVFCASGMHTVWEDEAELVTHVDGCMWYACTDHAELGVADDDHSCRGQRDP